MREAWRSSWLGCGAKLGCLPHPLTELIHPRPAQPRASSNAPPNPEPPAHGPQVTGEAQYTADAKLPPDALHAAFVTSSIPHGRLLSVDASAARALPGVAGYFDHTHVPGDNIIGPVKHDEEVFAVETVTCVGQVGGGVAARRGGGWGGDVVGARCIVHGWMVEQLGVRAAFMCMCMESLAPPPDFISTPPPVLVARLKYVSPSHNTALAANPTPHPTHMHR